MNARRFAMLIVVLVTSSVCRGGAGLPEDSSAQGEFDETAVLSTARSWASMVSQSDVVGLDTLLGDNYIHIHGTALVESKAQFLDAFNKGWRKYEPITIEDVLVRVFGNSAMVTGIFNLKAVVRGKTIEGVNRFGLVLVKTENGPRVVSFQATAIPQQK